MGGLRSLLSSFLQENGLKTKLLTNPAWKGAGSCLIQPSPQKGSSAASKGFLWLSLGIPSGDGVWKLQCLESPTSKLLLQGWEFLPKGLPPPPTDTQDLLPPL